MTALRKPRDDEGATVQAIVAAIDLLTEAKIAQLGGWQVLAELSTRTEFEAIGADESGIVLDDDRFEAVADIYVLLHYGFGEDEVSLSDSYVATIRGTVSDTVVTIDHIEVDTSPFFS